MKEKRRKRIDGAMGERTALLSFIAQPLSFRKVPGRSVAYWERLQNATGILSPHALA